MRKLIAILALCSFAFGADEIKRPTTDSDPGAATWATNNCDLGTTTASASGALGWDAAGQSTSVDYSASGSKSVARLTARQFNGWTASSQTYTALTLNVASSSNGSAAFVGAGAACVLYSLDAGSNWMTLRCDTGTGWAQTTSTVSLSTGQTLSQLRVGVCAWGDSGGGVLGNQGGDDVRVFDIWTDGVYTAATSGAGNTTRVRRPGIVFFD